MIISDCHWREAALAPSLHDLAFMLSCYDIYSGPAPGRCPGPATEAPKEGDGA